MLKDKEYKAVDDLLDEVLLSEPNFSLSSDFADEIATKVGRRYTLTQYFREFLIYLGAIAGLLSIFAGIAFIWYKADVQRWLDFLIGNISWVAGINVLIVFVLLVDKVVLPYMFYRSSPEEA